MSPNFTLLQIVLCALTIISGEVSRNKRGRRKDDDADKTLWKKEYEDELTDAMLTGKRENYTRSASPQVGSMDNDAVIEKLMESITSSERYLKKIEAIEFRLNRLDIEVHEKTNAMMKTLNNISKSVRAESCSKLEPIIQSLVADVTSIKYSMDKNPRSSNTIPDLSGDGEYLKDPNIDTRLSALESHMKTVQNGVESIVSTISEVKNRQYNRASSKLDGSVSTVDSVSLINEFRKTIREQKASKKCDCSRGGRVDRAERYPTDCHEIQVQGFNVSGIYKIKPDDMDPFYVLCDLTTAGGGWTVFQNRFDGSQDFYKGWSDYENGFGNLAGEFWLGLEKLNYLTNQKLYELRIEMETAQDQEAYAGYSVFTVGPEHEGYRISTLGTFYGTAGDSLSYHAGQKFSTYDVDNDEWKDGACATEHGGAWWYKECDKSNLNGKYSTNNDDNRGQSIYWISFKGPTSPLSKTKMMIRPLPASKPSDYLDSNRKIVEGPLHDKLVERPLKQGQRRQTTVKGKYDFIPSKYMLDKSSPDVFF
ncbi:hypothetical protein PYW07_000416 [Mythimna separata]|uniref:Fibrinogen C-terminal domain-containing protein n=1 Tax=Mythimna separata TaxID=271217 RepID=A0AAD7Z3W6_MYTSE|nr:hypothetical protein PYW07_000416 [Mythimna separata]